jgi:hypothetical protein
MQKCNIKVLGLLLFFIFGEPSGVVPCKVSHAEPGWSGVICVLGEPNNRESLPFPLNNENWPFVCVVGSVVKESNAKGSGLQSGDIIFKYSGKYLKTKEDFEAMADIENGDEIVLVVKRKRTEPRETWITKTIKFDAISKDVKKKYDSVVETLKENLSGDLIFELNHGYIDENVIGSPVIHFRIKNKTKHTIVALEFNIFCVNEFDEPAGNALEKIYQTPIPSGKEAGVEFTMNLNREATKAVFFVKRLKLSNEETWSETFLDAKENNRLRGAVKVK